jgi:hypothetical protein
MIAGKRVEIVIPAGRRRYIEILLSYLWREKDLVDTVVLWLNTADEDDLLYLRRIGKLCPEWIQVIPATQPVDKHRSLNQFYQFAMRSDTIYMKIDDDVCWLCPGLIRQMALARIADPQPYLVFANMINSPLPAHLHQRMGLMSTFHGLANYDPDCPIGCRSAEVAIDRHHEVLVAIKERRWPRYSFGCWHLYWFEKVSIHLICWFGEDLALPGENWDEEWLASDMPRSLNRPCIIHGPSVAVHFAFAWQREQVESTGLLSEYRDLARELPDSEMWSQDKV